MLSTIMCKNPSMCGKGEKCEYLHSVSEFLYHPEVYNEYPCPLPDKCELNNMCPFNHSKEEKLTYNTPHINEIRDMNKMLGTTQEDLEALMNQYKIKNAESYAMTYCEGCFEEVKEFYMIPCGHLLCAQCKEHEITCKVCGRRSSAIKINFS